MKKSTRGQVPHVTPHRDSADDFAYPVVIATLQVVWP